MWSVSLVILPSSIFFLTIQLIATTATILVCCFFSFSFYFSVLIIYWSCNWYVFPSLNPFHSLNSTSFSVYVNTCSASFFFIYRMRWRLWKGFQLYHLTRPMRKKCDTLLRWNCFLQRKFRQNKGRPVIWLVVSSLGWESGGYVVTFVLDGAIFNVLTWSKGLQEISFVLCAKHNMSNLLHGSCYLDFQLVLFWFWKKYNRCYFTI